MVEDLSVSDGVSTLGNQEWVYQEDFNEYVFPKPQQKMVDLLKKSMNN